MLNSLKHGSIRTIHRIGKRIAIIKFLPELSDVSRLERLRQRDSRAIDPLIEVYESILANLDPDRYPTFYADIQNNLAGAVRDRVGGVRKDNLERAIDCCQQALKVYARETYPEDWAMLQNTLGSVLLERITEFRADNIDRAIQHFNRALEVQTRDNYPVEWAMVHHNLAHAYRDRPYGSRAQALEDALHCCRQALKVYTRLDYSDEWAAVQVTLATIYHARIFGERAENLELGIHHCLQALEVRSREAFEEGWAVIQVTLGNIYRARILGRRADNLESAIKYYQQALTVLNPHTFPEDWVTVQTSLGVVYLERIQGVHAENIEMAIQYGQQSLQIARPHTLPEKWAANHHLLGSAYEERTKDDPAKNLQLAISHYQEALKVRQKELYPELWAMTKHNLTGAYLLERYQTSLTRRRNPLDVHKNSFAEVLEQVQQELAGTEIDYAIQSYQDVLSVFTREAFPAKHSITSYVLGKLLFASKRWAEAALAFDSTLDACEILYQVATAPKAKEVELREVGNIPALLTFAFAQVGDLNRAIETVERWRARALGEAMSLDAAQLDKLSPQDQAAFAETRTRIHDLQVEARLPVGNHSRRDFLTLTEELKAERATLQQIVQRIRHHETDFLPDPTFADVLIAAHAAPLVYLIVTNIGGFALIVYADSLQSIRLDFTEGDLNSLLLKFEDGTLVGGYVPAQLGARGLQQALDGLLPRIGEGIMAPLSMALDKVFQNSVTEPRRRQVVLIPTGRLSLLPLHAATYQGRAFQDDFVVTYAPSARGLARSREAAGALADQPPSLFAIGDPLPLPPGASPLAFAQTEVEEIASIFGGHRRTLCKTEATRLAVEQGLDTTSYLHLSCHGQFNVEKPLESGMTLSHGEALTLRKLLARARFKNTRLAVLSACQTAITDFQSLPDEAIGLPAGLIQAGVPGVVGTLWSVDDLSTALLMIQFYKYHLYGKPESMIEPLPPPQAMHRAQQWLRTVTGRELLTYFQELEHSNTAELSESSRRLFELVSPGALVLRLKASMDPNACPYAHPYYWAPFIFVGA